MKIGSKVRHVLGFTYIPALIVVCWSIAFFITSAIYNGVGVEPNDFVKELINSLLGFVIFFCVAICISKFTGLNQKRFLMFQTLKDAMQQIARGDFNVNLKIDSNNGKNPFGDLAENINHMASELNQMETMRQEFVSNVSHEIQSPLTSISGFAKILQNDELSPSERKHYADIIELESRRLSKLSDNLLKLTSLESEHHPFERVPYRLDHQLREIVLAFEPQWTDKSIEMDISLDKTEIIADRELMNQVWNNLINNSIKFTPEDARIKVELQKNDQEAVVRISDTGIGISKENLAHIFERFYKADKSRTRSVNGSGLGLSIVKKIISMHKGIIQVDSEPGKGTRMSVHLKLTRVESEK
ncbi:signal transduction histidine kinase [Scopulibacillus darangshiensis]|uniref:histidine kinase n=1 Tax=Scopulibacillus darangshiensis TaxID=442528 RepID=A0A4R2PEE0_9BACL|nr:HAMP domain-containing sensor histidine kinase [Scopulibacillus darangshiensis]TCP32295.1 signal transduction histidine kinase [Scopulibacillus darangshiensis]